MKIAAYIFIISAMAVFIFAVLSHVTGGALGKVFNLTPRGLLNGTSMLLFFGISFALLELMRKR